MERAQKSGLTFTSSLMAALLLGGCTPAILPQPASTSDVCGERCAVGPLPSSTLDTSGQIRLHHSVTDASDQARNARATGTWSSHASDTETSNIRSMPAMPADDADDGEQFNPWELLTGPLAQVCYETRLTVILLELDRPTTINTESGPVDLYLLTMKMEVLALEMYERKRQNRLQMTPDEVKQFFSEVDLKVRGKLEGADDESLVFTDNLCKKRADRFTPSARQLFEQPPSSSQEPAGIAVEEDASDKDEFSHWDLLTPVIARACYETRVEVIFLELDQLTLVNTDHGPRDLYLLAIMLQVGALEKLRRERENLLQITYDELEDFFFKIDSKVIKEIDPDGDRSMTMSHNTTCKKMVDPLMENARRVFEKK